MMKSLIEQAIDYVPRAKHAKAGTVFCTFLSLLLVAGP